MTRQTYTQIFILVTGLIWIAYDVYQYITGGNPATESATVWVAAYHIPGIAFMFGVLCGHFFFQMHAPTEFPTESKK